MGVVNLLTSHPKRGLGSLIGGVALIEFSYDLGFGLHEIFLYVWRVARRIDIKLLQIPDNIA